MTSNQYVNTGVQFSVTPRVNQGGQVTLEMDVELSSVADLARRRDARLQQDVGVVDHHGAERPDDPARRSDRGNVGQEQHRACRSSRTIPILGALFGEQKRDDNRQELVMLITPTLIPANQDLTDVTNELRKKMQFLQEEFPVKKRTLRARQPIDPQSARAIDAQGAPEARRDLRKVDILRKSAQLTRFPSGLLYRRNTESCIAAFPASS